MGPWTSSEHYTHDWCWVDADRAHGHGSLKARQARCACDAVALQAFHAYAAEHAESLDDLVRMALDEVQAAFEKVNQCSKLRSEMGSSIDSETLALDNPSVYTS